MYQQEESLVRSSIVALGCGLGKTLTSLLFLQATAREQERLHRELEDEDFEYRPTLLIVPGGAIHVWHEDIEKFYPNEFIVHQYYGSDVTTTNLRRKKTLLPRGHSSLNTLLEGMPRDDPKVSY